MSNAEEQSPASPASCHPADTSGCSSLRVKASCGHIIEPMSLKAWAKARIDTGLDSFPCQSCSKKWAWQELCKLALFTTAERTSYEKKLIELIKDDRTSYRKCPGCNLLVQRVDPESLCVECLSCSNARGKLYQFCWDCMREWKSPASHSTDCGNKFCNTTAMLLSCTLIDAPHLEVHQCPVIRACPNCETLVSHCQEGCPQVECPNCFYEFCYRCLGIEECNYAEFVELSDDEDTDYEDLDDSSECVIAGRQKITGRKNYRVNPTHKLSQDDATESIEEGSIEEGSIEEGSIEEGSNDQRFS